MKIVCLWSTTSVQSFIALAQSDKKISGFCEIQVLRKRFTKCFVNEF